MKYTKMIIPYRKNNKTIYFVSEWISTIDTYYERYSLI